MRSNRSYTPVHHGTHRHRKTRRLSRSLSMADLGLDLEADKIPRWVAMGILTAAWDELGDLEPDGNLSAYTAEDIADAIDFDGNADALVNALVEAGYLDKSGDGYAFHDWHLYEGGVLAAARDREEQRREKDAARKREKRAAAKTETEKSEPEPKSARPRMSADVRGRPNTRRDETRRDPPLTPPSGGSSLIEASPQAPPRDDGGGPVTIAELAAGEQQELDPEHPEVLSAVERLTGVRFGGARTKRRKAWVKRCDEAGLCIGVRSLLGLRMSGFYEADEAGRTDVGDFLDRVYEHATRWERANISARPRPRARASPTHETLLPLDESAFLFGETIQ